MDSTSDRSISRPIVLSAISVLLTVAVLVGWILVLTALLVVGTRVEGERPSLRPTSGP